jgi:hypothetical protein
MRLSQLADFLPFRCPFKGLLNCAANNLAMRVILNIAVALLIFNFVDEHFFGAQYTEAAVAMLSEIVRSFG